MWKTDLRHFNIIMGGIWSDPQDLVIVYSIFYPSCEEDGRHPGMSWQTHASWEQVVAGIPGPKKEKEYNG